MKIRYPKICYFLLPLLIGIIGCDQVKFVKRSAPAKVKKVVYQEQEVPQPQHQPPLIVPPGIVVEKQITNRTINNTIPGNGQQVVMLPANGSVQNGDNRGDGEWGKARLIFDITGSDNPGVKIDPDFVALGGREVKERDYVAAGEYKLTIRKEGYHPIADQFIVPEDKRSVTIKYEMEKKAETPAPTAGTVFEWDVKTEYENESIEPETVLLDGDEINYGDEVQPGNHTIEIRHPGHEILQKQIDIPQVPVYKFQATLLTLPRSLQVSVVYDIEPPASLGEKVVYLTANATGEEKIIEGNDRVKPGVYQIKVEKEGYLTQTLTKRIYPATSPEKVEVELQAKPVIINASIVFDIQPPQDLPAHLITFIPEQGNRQQINPGGSIRPGKYEYIVEKPGYKMRGGQKELVIEPSETPYSIEEELIAQPRNISFDVEDDQKRLIQPLSIEINGKQISFSDTFKPGESYRMIVKFKNYQTVEKDILITPGSGPYVLEVNLVRK